MAIFITGTDTNVGKTLISTWICIHSGWTYFKPIQTGTDSDSSVVARIAGVPIHGPIFSFPEPIAPHIAAKAAGKLIDISKIALPGNAKTLFKGKPDPLQENYGKTSAPKETNPLRKNVCKISPNIGPSLQREDNQEISIDEADTLQESHQKILVEGAGGVLVPLQENGIKMVDLIQHLGLPVIVVARATLGAINHTLLTLEALRARKIKVLGIIVNSTNKDSLEYTADAIAKYGSAKILMNFPYLEEVSRDALLGIPVPGPLQQILYP